MTDNQAVSIPTSPTEFKTGQHVQVDNLDTHGMPGPFHACRGHIRMLFMEAGQVAAKVEFNNGVQRKMFVTKLIPVKLAPQPVRPQPAPLTPAPKLPTWAKPDYMMVRGDHLQSGDLIYFTRHANPRMLMSWKDDRTWSGHSIINWYGFEKLIPSVISISPDHWYVVGRK